MSNRVLSPSVLPIVGGIAFLMLQRAMDLILACVRHSMRWSFEHCIEVAKGIKKRRYRKASASLAIRPLSRKDGLIQGFTKREKLDPKAKVNPDPRMIMYRSPRFTLSFLSYVHPAEHVLFNYKGDGYQLPKGYQFAKFHDSVRRGEVIASKFNAIKERYGACVVVSLDGSRYDMHLSRAVQQVTEMRFIDENVRGKECDWGVIKNTVYFLRDIIKTKLGLQAEGELGRKSGESITSFGNSLDMYAMLIAFMIFYLRIPVAGFDVYDDGDDCLLFMAPDFEARVQAMIGNFFSELGFDLKLENRATEIEEIIFCQCRPIFDGAKWRMVRAPWRVLSRGTTVLYGGSDKSIRLDHCYSTGKCELALNAGVPILQEYASALVRNANGGKLQSVTQLAYEHRFLKGVEKAKELEITNQARQSFAKAFGITPTRQSEVEAYLRDWKFSTALEPAGVTSYDAEFRDLISFV